MSKFNLLWLWKPIFYRIYNNLLLSFLISYYTDIENVYSMAFVENHDSLFWKSVVNDYGNTWLIDWETKDGTYYK